VKQRLSSETQTLSGVRHEGVLFFGVLGRSDRSYMHVTVAVGFFEISFLGGICQATGRTGKETRTILDPRGKRKQNELEKSTTVRNMEMHCRQLGPGFRGYLHIFILAFPFPAWPRRARPVAGFPREFFFIFMSIRLLCDFPRLSCACQKREVKR
jgi:hypothetical protein